MAPPSPIPRRGDLIEASCRLPEDLKVRYLSVPWPKVEGIGTVVCAHAMLLAAPR